MMGQNVCFKGLYGELSLNYPFYPFLPGVLVKLLMRKISPKGANSSHKENPKKGDKMENGRVAFPESAFTLW